MAHPRLARQKIQPIGCPCRRESTKTPTAGKVRMEAAPPTASVTYPASNDEEAERTNASRTRPAVTSAVWAATIDHSSTAVALDLTASVLYLACAATGRRAQVAPSPARSRAARSSRR